MTQMIFPLHVHQKMMTRIIFHLMLAIFVILDKIAGGIDNTYHKVSFTPWLIELIIIMTATDGKCIEINIFRFIASIL